MPAMDTPCLPRSAAARQRTRLRASLTVAGSAVLLAACTVLEPSVDRDGIGTDRAAAPASSGPPVAHGGRHESRPARSGARKADGQAGREPTRLPDQLPATLEPDEASPSAETPAVRPTSPRHRGARAVARPAPPAGLAGDVDAAPERIEPLHPTANRSYTVANRRYHPMRTRQPFRQRGMASWYGKDFHGRRTATGERFDMTALTAAHPTLPLPSWVKVTNAGNGQAVVVRVNDRGPFGGDRVIDLSHAAAERLGFVDDGLATVEVEMLLPDDGAQTDSAD